jgi:hypothetical protein
MLEKDFIPHGVVCVFTHDYSPFGGCVIPCAASANRTTRLNASQDLTSGAIWGELFHSLRNCALVNGSGTALCGAER